MIQLRVFHTLYRNYFEEQVIPYRFLSAAGFFDERTSIGKKIKNWKHHEDEQESDVHSRAIIGYMKKRSSLRFPKAERLVEYLLVIRNYWTLLLWQIMSIAQKSTSRPTALAADVSWKGMHSGIRYEQSWGFHDLSVTARTRPLAEEIHVVS